MGVQCLYKAAGSKKMAIMRVDRHITEHGFNVYFSEKATLDFHVHNDFDIPSLTLEPAGWERSRIGPNAC